MKMLFTVAAALAALVAAPAVAAPTPQGHVVVRERTVTTPAARRTVVTERTTVRRDRGWHRGWRTRTRCDWRWRNHHRVRVCRTVRYRY